MEILRINNLVFVKIASPDGVKKPEAYAGAGSQGLMLLNVPNHPLIAWDKEGGEAFKEFVEGKRLLDWHDLEGRVHFGPRAAGHLVSAYDSQAVQMSYHIVYALGKRYLYHPDSNMSCHLIPRTGLGADDVLVPWVCGKRTHGSAEWLAVPAVTNAFEKCPTNIAVQPIANDDVVVLPSKQEAAATPATMAAQDCSRYGNETAVLELLEAVRLKTGLEFVFFEPKAGLFAPAEADAHYAVVCTSTRKLILAAFRTYDSVLSQMSLWAAGGKSLFFRESLVDKSTKFMDVRRVQAEEKRTHKPFVITHDNIFYAVTSRHIISSCTSRLRAMQLAALAQIHGVNEGVPCPAAEGTDLYNALHAAMTTGEPKIVDKDKLFAVNTKAYTIVLPGQIPGVRSSLDAGVGYFLYNNNPLKFAWWARGASINCVEYMRKYFADEPSRLGWDNIKGVRTDNPHQAERSFPPLMIIRSKGKFIIAVRSSSESLFCYQQEFDSLRAAALKYLEFIVTPNDDPMLWKTVVYDLSQVEYIELPTNLTGQAKYSLDMVADEEAASLTSATKEVPTPATPAATPPEDEEEDEEEEDDDCDCDDEEEEEDDCDCDDEEEEDEEEEDEEEEDEVDDEDDDDDDDDDEEDDEDATSSPASKPVVVGYADLVLDNPVERSRAVDNPSNFASGLECNNNSWRVRKVNSQSMVTALEYLDDRCKSLPGLKQELKDLTALATQPFLRSCMVRLHLDHNVWATTNPTAYIGSGHYEAILEPGTGTYVRVFNLVVNSENCAGFEPPPRGPQCLLVPLSVYANYLYYNFTRTPAVERMFLAYVHDMKIPEAAAPTGADVLASLAQKQAWNLLTRAEKLGYMNAVAPLLALQKGIVSE